MMISGFFQLIPDFLSYFRINPDKSGWLAALVGCVCVCVYSTKSTNCVPPKRGRMVHLNYLRHTCDVHSGMAGISYEYD